MSITSYIQQTNTSNIPLLSKFRPLNQLRQRKTIIILAIIIAVAIISFAGYTLYGTTAKTGNPINNAVASNPAPQQKVQLPPAKDSLTINKELSFPIKDSVNKEVGNIKYILESADLRDEIIVKGQKATSVEGRTFLIFNLKLVNEADKGVNLKTRDFVRLSSNNGGEWLAPDIHNDPVEIQAISTKYTRVGFPINETNKKFKLQVGEINGKKEIIDLNF